MARSQSVAPGIGRWICLIAKVLGLIWSVFVGAFGFGEGIPGLIQAARAGDATGGRIAMLIFLAVTIAGVIIALRWPGAGGVITIIGAVLWWYSFYLIEGYRGIKVAFLFSLPFLVAGLLFLICWRMKRVDQPK